MRGSVVTSSAHGPRRGAASAPTRLRGVLLVLVVLVPSLAIFQPRPVDADASEQPSGTNITNAADSTTPPSTTNRPAGASTTLLTDTSGATEATDKEPDVSDAKGSGFSGSQARDSAALGEGTADVVPTSGTAGATLTGDSASGTNSTPDTLAAGSSGSNSTTSAASGGVPDTLPESTPVGSQSADSSPVADSPPAVDDLLMAGSGGTQGPDDSTATEAIGQLAAADNDKADSPTPTPDLDVTKQVAEIESMTLFAADGDSVTVTTDFEELGDAVTAPDSVCVFRVLARNSNNSPVTWDLVVSNGNGHVWVWDATIGVGGDWKKQGTTAQTTITTTFAISYSHANKQWHDQYAVVYECEDPNHQPQGDKIRVTMTVDRREWIKHEIEINSVPTSTGETTISGKLRVLLDQDSAINEDYTNAKVHFQMFNLQTNTWQTEITPVTVGTISLIKDGDSNPDASHGAGLGVPFTVSFSLPVDNPHHISQYRLWAELTEPNGNRNTQAESGDTLVSNYVVVDRTEWITHTGTLSGVYADVPGGLADQTSPFSFQVTADVDEPKTQTFTGHIRVDAQRADTGAWAADVWTGSSFTVTITNAGSSGDTASTTFSGTLTLPSNPNYKAWRVYGRFTEPANDLNGVAEDGTAIDTAKMVVNRKEWITHTLKVTNVAAKTADAFLDVTVRMDIDQAAPIAETFRVQVRLWAFDLATDSWTGVLDTETSASLSLAAGGTQSASATLQLAWTSSNTYSKFRVQANGTEPLGDKNPYAESGDNVYTKEIEVERREWIAHRAHLRNAPTQSSDTQDLSAEVWVETDIAVTMDQTYQLYRILEGYKTGVGWDAAPIANASNVASVTIFGTGGGGNGTHSNHTTLTWPSLPSAPDYEKYRLKVKFQEPNVNADNSIADEGSWIDARAEVSRTEWVLDTLNVKVPERADPAAVVTVETWITTDVDIDNTRTYRVRLVGSAYNQSSAQWRTVLDTNVTITWAGTTATGQTESPHETLAWALPPTGYDSKYSLNASFFEDTNITTNVQPGEDTFAKVSKNFDQSALGFERTPTVRRVVDNPTPVTSQFYWPGDTVTVYSEINYTYGGDWSDYGTNPENVRYRFFEPGAGTPRATYNIPINGTGFTQATLRLPANASYGVWSVEVYYRHDDDSITDANSATFLVRPLISSLTTKRNGNATADVYQGAFTVEAGFVNNNIGLGPTFNATLAYPSDDAGTNGTVYDANPSVDATTDKATFTFNTTSVPIQGGDGTVHVRFSTGVTYYGQSVTLTAETGDGDSCDDALVHIIATEQPTRNFHTLTHDATTTATGSTTNPGVATPAVTDTSGSAEADKESDVGDTKPSGFSGSQARNSGVSGEGTADVVPEGGTAGSTLAANSGSGLSGAAPDARDATPAGSNSTTSNAAGGVPDALPATTPVGSNTTDSSASTLGGIPDVVGSGESGSQSDNSTASETIDQLPASDNDQADNPGTFPNLDLGIQVAEFVGVPTTVTRNDGFPVTYKFGGDAPTPATATSTCTITAKGFNETAAAWESVSGTSNTNVWGYDATQLRWETSGSDSVAYTHTVTDNNAGARQYHSKYVLRLECNDPDNQPSGDKIRVAVELKRSEWITHTGEVNSLPTSTGQTTITGKFRASLDVDLATDHVLGDVVAHLDTYNLQTNTWTNDVATANVNGGTITVAEDAGNAAPDQTHGAGDGVSFSLAFTLGSDAARIARYRVYVTFSEPTPVADNSIADTGQKIRTRYGYVDRTEWISHTGTLSGVRTHEVGSTSSLSTAFDFQVTSDLDEPKTQTFTAVAHVDAQRVSDGAWVADAWTSSGFTVQITSTASSNSDTASNTHSGTFTLPADPNYRAWRAWIRFTEPANDLNPVAEDGVAIDTAKLVILRKEWITHTLRITSVAERTADAFLDVAVRMDIDQAAPIAETYRYTLEMQAFDLATGAWTGALDAETSPVKTLSPEATQAQGHTLQVAWTQSNTYSKFRVRANATEPTNDKSGLAETGDNLYTEWVEVQRREWIAHVAHLRNAPTQSSDSQQPPAEVWVQTTSPVTMDQTFQVYRILEGYKTGVGWDATPISNQSNVASVTVRGTGAGGNGTHSNHTTLSWPSLPTDADYETYRLTFQFQEPTTDHSAGISDEGGWIDVRAEVLRTEWALDTLNVEVPPAADPDATVSVRVWITTDVDIDNTRTYAVALRGHAYNQSAGQWRQVFTDTATITWAGTTATGQTTSPSVTKTWNLPQSGHDSKYSINASYTEDPDVSTNRQPAEASLIRTAKDFDQSSLTFNVAPKVKRVEDQSGTAEYYYPAENLTVWSEVNYTHGAEWKDYGTVSEAATYDLLDPNGDLRFTQTAAVDGSGFSQKTMTLPADAAFGVWKVRTTYRHDSDEVVDNSSATFVVKPVLDKLVTQKSGAAATTFAVGDSITLEAHYVNQIITTGTSHLATLRYEDTTYAETTATNNAPSTSGNVATYSIAVPTDTADRDGRLKVNLSHVATYKGQSITIATETRDGSSVVEALVHLRRALEETTIGFDFVSGKDVVSVPQLSPSLPGDWFVDSFEPDDERAIEFNAGTSNRNVVLYFDTASFTPTAKVRGQSTGLTLTGINYQNGLSPFPTAGTWKDGSTWRALETADANYPGTWIYFNDGREAGTVRDDTGAMTASNSAAASTPNAPTNYFSPGFVATTSGSNAHRVTVTTLPTSSNLQWSNGNAPSGSDFAYEVVVPLYRETSTGGTGGTAGTLESRYVQVLLRSDGSEVAVHEGGTSSLGANWDATGWDRAKVPDGALGLESLDANKAKNVAATLFGNRYTVFSTSTTGDGEVVLAQAVLLPERNPASSGKVFVAIAFPSEAPSGDYSWSFTLKAVEWSDTDGLANTPDEVQYP